jgi:two-component system sensor histidine kinase HydH
VEPDGGARRPPFHPPPIVVEFAPLSAIAARALARRTLWGGMVAVPLFIAGGLALAYTVRQRERLTQRIEHGRRLAALGEMSAVIAHEIRNPLASLKGHAQLLSESLTGDTRQSKADRVVGEAVRIENLVSDLLEFSRTGTLDLREADPIAVLHTAVDDIDRARVIERSAGAPRRWRLDAASMKQVLANILRNALQASPDDSPVEAAVYATGPSLVFEIRDHGTGIPAGEEEKIFEPFHTHKTRGTGLGLALVRRIVAQHGGQVVAHNAPGGGAVFRVSIPRR